MLALRIHKYLYITRRLRGPDRFEDCNKGMFRSTLVACLFFPIVSRSANGSDFPIAIEALKLCFLCKRFSIVVLYAVRVLLLI